MTYINPVNTNTQPHVLQGTLNAARAYGLSPVSTLSEAAKKDDAKKTEEKKDAQPNIFVRAWNAVVSFFKNLWTSITSMCGCCKSEKKDEAKTPVAQLKAIVALADAKDADAKAIKAAIEALPEANLKAFKALLGKEADKMIEEGKSAKEIKAAAEKYAANIQLTAYSEAVKGKDATDKGATEAFAALSEDLQKEFVAELTANFLSELGLDPKKVDFAKGPAVSKAEFVLVDKSKVYGQGSTFDADFVKGTLLVTAPRHEVVVGTIDALICAADKKSNVPAGKYNV